MLQLLCDDTDVGDMLAKLKARRRPYQHPYRAAKRIEKEKPLPIHSQHACHDAV
jgi:hypothetical protein